MGSYPLGGMAVQDNDVGAIPILNAIYDEFIYVPPVADATSKAGLMLALNIALTKLVPYVAGAVDATAVPVAVLTSDVIADAGPADIELSALVGGQVSAGIVHTALAPTAQITIEDRARLRQTGIVPLKVLDLSLLDNQ